jgi:nitrogen fixation protein NifB
MNSFHFRKLNDVNDRPGVTSSLLSPEIAFIAVRRAVTLCPNLVAASVARPGDSLSAIFAKERN